MLSIVATPIGNLEDISPRALRALREAVAIGAEDTRHTRKLLAHFDVHTPLFSFHRHNEQARTDEIVARLRNGEAIAIVSDAGMPLVSDAGSVLVARLQAEGLAYTCIPGPTAVETALVLSGLPAAQYQFLGFVPRTQAERSALWQTLKSVSLTSILFESPQRLGAFLDEAAPQLGDRTMVVARELTKIHEEVRKGTATELAAHYRASGVKGECVVLVAPAPPQPQTLEGDPAAMVATVQRVGGVPHAAAAKIVAALTGRPKREVYRASTEPPVEEA